MTFLNRYDMDGLLYGIVAKSVLGVHLITRKNINISVPFVLSLCCLRAHFRAPVHTNNNKKIKKTHEMVEE